MTTNGFKNVAEEGSFEEAVHLYLLECKYRNLSRETIRKYRSSLKKVQHRLESLGLEFATLTSQDLTHTLIPNMLEGLSVRTVNCTICILKELFKFLYRECWLTTNIGENLRLLKVEQELVHTFTEEHIQELLSQPVRSTFTGFRNYIMMLVLLDTGVRLKELATLRVADVNFEEEIIIIRRGKGRKPRIAPIQRTCLMQLRLYLIERGAVQHEYLWTNLDNQPFDSGGIRAMVTRYCKKAQIKGIQCSCHTFRHTMAKRYLLNGGDIFSLKQILGHERIETTQYYVELFSKDLQTQHEKYSPLENMVVEFPGILDETGVLP